MSVLNDTSGQHSEDGSNSDDKELDLFSRYNKEREEPLLITNQNDWKRKINLYLAEEKEVSTVDVLKWWKNHQKPYPRLARMARDYLAIPASSVPSERFFTLCSLTI